MAVATFFMNYAYNSPFKELVPPISDLWQHPAYFFTGWKNVIVMHERNKGMKAQEARFQNLDDVAKRKYFMKMHGIEVKDPVSVVFGRGEKMTDGQAEARVLGLEEPPKEEEPPAPRKKWFGVL